MTVRVAALVAFVVLALGSATGPVLAHESDARVEAEPFVVAPGGGVRIAGSGFTAGGELAVRIEARQARAEVVRQSVDPAGAFSVVVRVPPELPAGAYAIVARDADGDEIIGSLTLDPLAGPGVAVGSPAGLGGALLVAVILGIGLGGTGALIRRHRSARGG